MLLGSLSFSRQRKRFLLALNEIDKLFALRLCLLVLGVYFPFRFLRHVWLRRQAKRENDGRSSLRDGTCCILVIKVV